MSEILFQTLGTSQRILKLLESEKEFGGPQSINDVCQNLQMSNRNARSILSRMYKKGKIDRVSEGVYRVKGDVREYDASKPHHKAQK